MYQQTRITVEMQVLTPLQQQRAPLPQPVPQVVAPVVLSCSEDSVTTPMDPFFDKYVTRSVKQPSEVPWMDAYAKGDAYELPFPISDISYDERARTRELSFTIACAPSAAAIGEGRKSLEVTISHAEVMEALLVCKCNRYCHHLLCPLRISVVRTACNNTPEVPVNFQLHCNAFDIRGELEESKTRYHWIAPTSYEKRADVPIERFRLQLLWNERINYALSPRIVYLANEDDMHPDTFDWITAMAPGSQRLQQYIHELDSENVYVQQPGRDNTSPNLLSYQVARILQNVQNGASKQQYSEFTEHTVGAVKPYFRFTRSAYNTYIRDVLQHLSQYKGILNTKDSGLTGSFIPADMHQWNKELQDSEKNIYMNVTLKIDYLVLGHFDAFVQTASPPVFSRPPGLG